MAKLYEVNGKTPTIDHTAFLAGNCCIAGDVRIGPECVVMHGAQIVAEGAPVTLGRRCIVLENAVLRGAEGHPCVLGDFCLVGPCAHVVGAEAEAEVFIATGAAVFHGARLGQGSEVRVHGVVHTQTRLEPQSVVPIGWVAVGDPAKILAPNEHEAIWAVQQGLNFPAQAYGLTRQEASMEAITQVMRGRLAGSAGGR